MLSVIELNSGAFKGIDDQTETGKVFRAKLGVVFMPHSCHPFDILAGPVLGLSVDAQGVQPGRGLRGRSWNVRAEGIDVRVFVFPGIMFIFRPHQQVSSFERFEINISFETQDLVGDPGPRSGTVKVPPVIVVTVHICIITPEFEV